MNLPTLRANTKQLYVVAFYQNVFGWRQGQSYIYIYIYIYIYNIIYVECVRSWTWIFRLRIIWTRMFWQDLFY